MRLAAITLHQRSDSDLSEVVNTMCSNISKQGRSKIAVIGGGIAGSTIALRLAELGIDTTLIEKSNGLVSGPPICHLHAGGNLYREIPDEQCVQLLQQSIDTLKIYTHCINWRPTVIALPIWDKSQPASLLPRLTLLQQKYSQLIAQNSDNAVLGDPQHYFLSYSQQELKALSQKATPLSIQSEDDWMIPVAKHLDFSSIQFPVFLVQEYGLSAFRFAAACEIAMSKLDRCHLKLSHRVESLSKLSTPQKGWHVAVKNSQNEAALLEFDYVVNACGFRSGKMDDMLALKRERFVECKSAYVARWQESKGHWPEIIFHGERGTPQGMAQLTPNADGYFQIHGMTESISLFEDGLSASSQHSAQPELAAHHLEKISADWSDEEVLLRTDAAISHVAQFLPSFRRAKLASKPLYGAQQIPGNDPNLRTADVSFSSERYARAEIVKASSALAAADAILDDLNQKGLINLPAAVSDIHEHYFPVTTTQCSLDDIDTLAESIAVRRGYPPALAKQKRHYRGK